MVKNFSDHAGLQDGGNDFHFSVTLRAVFDIDIDIEYPLEQTHPTDAYRGWKRWRIVSRIGYIAFAFLAARNDFAAQFGVRRKYAMESNEVKPWPGNQRGQSLHELQWRQDDVGRTIPIRRFQR